VVNFNSNLFDLNEFMTEPAQPATADTTKLGVIPVPDNIDFTLKSSIKTVKVTDLTLTNATGDVIVKDGVADLSNVKFNMLGGGFTVNGTYNTKDMNHPKYNFGLKIDNMSIKEAANMSSIVKTYAPVAGLVNGNFSSDFKINGELGQDMMPKLATVNADGVVKIIQAALTESKLVSSITSLTKLDDTNQVTLKDAMMAVTIKDGKLSVKPFDAKFGNYKTTIGGSTDLDGTLAYTMKMDVPAGKLGAQFNSFVSQYAGTKADPNTNIPLTIGLGGKINNPTPKLLMDDQKKQAQTAITNAAKEEGTKALEKAVKGTDAEDVVNSILGKKTKKDSTAADTTKNTTTDDTKKKLEDDAKKKIQNLLRRN